jgi:hypothetical protein
LLAFGRAILEEIQEALVDPLDSLEEFVNPDGCASELVCGRGGRYDIAKLGCTADTFGREQGKHGARILVS